MNATESKSSPKKKYCNEWCEDTGRRLRLCSAVSYFKDLAAGDKYRYHLEQPASTVVKVVVKKGGKTYSYSYDYVTVKISQPTFFRLLEVKQRLEVKRRRQSLPGKITMNDVIHHLIEKNDAELRREEEVDRV